ncbi:tumor necrosis factor ligand superfamily member 10 isoform X2 [Scyliorhinus torazame]|uniref:tumor necrosis factor ligand superfamily member 10 isoform X2 n=1 Tax=Scyliorhinus torazame TaxID=75743 RepID=UPI003B5CA698
MGTSSNSITAQRLGFALSSVLLLQCVCMTLTFLYFHSELKQVQESFAKNNMACLTEDILHPHAGPKGGEEFYGDPTREKTERNEDLCWKFRAQIQQLIEKTISNQYEQDMSVIVKGPVSRKLQGQKIRTWDPERGLAFLHSVEYKDGELIIPKTGLYYIYGQTYFRYCEAADSSPADSLSVSRNTQMVQYIYKNTAYPEPILLMKNTRTICWARNREYELHSIYQGGVFQLNYHDRIFVTVSNVSWVDMAAGSSFFGAFLVS